MTRSDGDYRTDFNCEIASAAALCGALAKSDLTFEQDWNTLVLELTHEYGSQWRWKNTLGSIKVSIRRDTLLELRERKVPTSEYPQYWQVVAAYKWGPPDYVPHAWPVERDNVGARLTKCRHQRTAPQPGQHLSHRVSNLISNPEKAGGIPQ